MNTPDGSVVDGTGNVIYFSVDRFVSDICEGGCCFVCGVGPDAAQFSDEHILPRWILKKFNLFDRTIGVPNTAQFPYGRYTVPCCLDCNQLTGRLYFTCGCH